MVNPRLRRSLCLFPPVFAARRLLFCGVLFRVVCFIALEGAREHDREIVLSS